MLPRLAMNGVLNAVLERLPGSIVAGGYALHLALQERGIEIGVGDVDVFVPAVHRGNVMRTLIGLFHTGILDTSWRPRATRTSGFGELLGDQYEQVPWILNTYQVPSLRLNVIVVDSLNLTYQNLYQHFDLDICKVRLVRGIPVLSAAANEVLTRGMESVVGVNQLRLNKYRTRLQGIVNFEELV